MRIKEVVSATDPGTKRSHNEDAVYTETTLPLLAIADGMGKAGDGHVAAQKVLEVLRSQMELLQTHCGWIAEKRSTENRVAFSHLLSDLFNQASGALRKEAVSVSKNQLTSTLLVMTLVRNFAYIAHVGNSRAYLWRDGSLRPLTVDHSLAEYRYRRGRMSREDYDAKRSRYVLYQTLGTGMEVDVDLAEVRLQENDLLLLCSDGLFRALEEEQIADLLQEEDPQKCVDGLIQAANAWGTPDNISVVLASFESEQEDEPIEAITEVMREVFLFQDFSEPELLVIAPYLEEVVFDKGEKIIREGEPGEHFFLVASGQVRITRGKTHLIDIEPGGHFGELALTRPILRSATARAVEQTWLFSLSRERFQEILRYKPELGARLSILLLDTVGARLRDLSERLVQIEQTVRGTIKHAGNT